MINKREYPRINATYSARYRRSVEDSTTEVELENISANGALFTGNYRVEEGTNLEMRIELPQVGEIPLPAEVVRIEKEKGALNRYKIAVKFRDKERRQYPRLKVKYLAWYRDKSKGSEYMPVTLDDISAGGASFISEKRLNPGEEIDLDIVLPGAGKTPMRAKVIRVNLKKRTLRFFEIGVEFIREKVYKPSIDYIDELVEKRMATAT